MSDQLLESWREMSHKHNRGSAETSHQGTLNMIQQDLQGHMIDIEDKIDKLQEQIERLVTGLNSRNDNMKKE